MTEATEFPNVVLWATGYLRTALQANGYATVRVADTYKGSAPFEVWIQRDGGPVLDVKRELPRLRINCYADGTSSQPVDDLARRVSTIMRAAAGAGPVRKVTQMSGPTSIEDTRPRRYMLFELTVVGSHLTLA